MHPSAHQDSEYQGKGKTVILPLGIPPEEIIKKACQDARTQLEMFSLVLFRRKEGKLEGM